MQKSRKFVFSLALTLVLGCATAFTNIASAQDISPMSRVETMVNAVLAILGNDTLTIDESETAVKEVLFVAFDSRAMAQSVLSSNWRDASSSQQEEFEALFLQTLENTYINRIEAYTDERVDFIDEDINKKRSTVKTLIITSNNDIPVDYKLRQRSDGWFIYDVVVENVSMISSYRDTYRSVVRKSSMDGLLAQMRDKVAELEQ